MFYRIAETGLPIFLSTGMSSLSEIDTTVDMIRGMKLPLTVLQCTSQYPCPPEKVGLNMIPFLKERYECAVGLSDHSGTIFPGLSAVTLGISVLEVHVTMSREMFGPDVSASITTKELAQLVEGVRYVERMTANPVDKDAMASELAPIRSLFTKSVVINQDLSVGTVLNRAHLAAKKPGTGIPADQMESFIGRKLRRDMLKDEQLHEDDCEALLE